MILGSATLPVLNPYTINQDIHGFDMTLVEQGILKAFPKELNCETCLYRGMVLSPTALKKVLDQGMKTALTTNKKEVFMSANLREALRHTLPTNVPGDIPSNFISVFFVIDFTKLESQNVRPFGQRGGMSYSKDVPPGAIREIRVYNPETKQFEVLDPSML